MAALTDAQLKTAIKAREDGKPLPSGVNWSAHRQPQFMSVDEYAEFEKNGGVLSEAANARILTERKLLSAFDAYGAATKVAATEGEEAAPESQAKK